MLFMKKLLIALLLVFCAFVIFFAVPPDGFLWWILILIIVKLIAGFVIEFLEWWFNPKKSCSNWDYISDKQRKKYLEEQKEKRNKIRKKLGIKKLE